MTNLACASFVGALRPNITPSIQQTSSTSSIAGGNSYITLKGTNYRDYSIVNFGQTRISPQFISSSILTFKIPEELPYGTYFIFVSNDNLNSNSVEYQLDESDGFWERDESTFSISNKNKGDVDMSMSNTEANYSYAKNMQAGIFEIREGGIPTYLPIHRSIPDLKNYYSYSPTSTRVKIEIGTPMSLNLKDTSLGDISITTLPGYEISLIDDKKNYILRVKNDSNNAVMAQPYDSGSKIDSLEVRIKKNGSWRTI